MLILMAMWTRESCDFPDDDSRLAKVSRVSLRLWKSRIGSVLRPFFHGADGALVSKRLRQEAAYVERQVQQQSDRKAGEKPANPPKTNNPPPSADTTAEQPRGLPSQLPNYPSIKTGASNEALVVAGDDPPPPPPPAEPTEAEVFAMALTAFNEAAARVGWPQAKGLSKSRKGALRGRLKDAGGLDGWRDALARAEASDFLCSRSGGPRPFMAHIDFLLQASSFQKLSEGLYDNRSAPNIISMQPKGRTNALIEGYMGIIRDIRDAGMADGPGDDPLVPLLPARH
jgi:hypothetical protein